MREDKLVNQLISELDAMPFDQTMELILKSLSIECEDDIDKQLVLNEHGFIESELVDEFVSILFYFACKKATDQVIKAHSNKKQFFFHKSLYSNENTDYINTYATLFPQRFVLYTPDIFLNGKAKIEDSKNEVGISLGAGTSLIRYYLRHKALIKNGDFFIFPQAVFDISENSKHVRIPSCANRKNKCFLDTIGSKIDIIPRTDYLNLIIEIPWLKDARVEDFFELREKYKTEYELFSIQTDKLMLAARSGNRIETLLAKEYNEAALEIRNTMVKQRALLKRTGLEVAMGSICTIVPVVLDQMGFDYFDPQIISSVVGGTTIYSGIKQFFENSSMARGNPYWILYQWEQKTKQRKSTS